MPMGDVIHSLGKILIIIGIITVAIGGLLLLSWKIPWIGRLPGDIIIERKHFTLYFPLATSILISIILILILSLIGRR